MKQFYEKASDRGCPRDGSPCGPFRHDPGVTGARRVPSDEAADAETQAGRGKAELQSLFRTSTVRRILDELSKRKEFQMPKNRRDGELLLAAGWKTECGEIYSPPRVTQVISELGLRPAWSLDLTTVDPEDGMPWDFSVAAKNRGHQDDGPGQAYDACGLPYVRPILGTQ